MDGRIRVFGADDFYVPRNSDYLMMHSQNPLTRAAQTPEGQAVVVKVLAIRDEGHECLSIIRRVSSGPLALLSNNHCLPLIKELDRKSTRLNSSHSGESRMPSSA